MQQIIWMFSLLGNKGENSLYNRPSFSFKWFLKNSANVSILKSQNQKAVLGDCFKNCIMYQWS